MSNDEDLSKARVSDIVPPDVRAMVLHRAVVLDLVAVLGLVEVGIHDKNWIVVLLRPIHLRKHSALLEVIIDGHGPSPHASSNCAGSLDENKGSPLGIQGLLVVVRPVELLAHPDWASGIYRLALHLDTLGLGNTNLLQADQILKVGLDVLGRKSS